MNEYYQDFLFFMNEIEKHHFCFYFDKKKAEVLSYVERLFKMHNLNSAYDLSYFIKRVLKYTLSVYDSHTYCFYKQRRKLPLKLKLINGDLYIIDAVNKELIGAKIIMINSVSTSVLISEIKEALPYSTTGWLVYNVENNLSDLNTIFELPSVVNTNDKINITTYKDGVLKDSVITDNEHQFTKEKEFDVRVKDNVMIIKYSKCCNPDGANMEEQVEKIKCRCERSNITDFIVDIRGNTGGDNRVIKPLINFLSSKTYNVVTLTDERVFSSGRFALVDLIHIGSKTVGTGIGTSFNCFGNVKIFRLPNTGLIISYSTKYFCFNSEKCAMSQVTTKAGLKEIADFSPYIFSPDYFVNKEIDDYIGGNDPVLNEAIRVINNCKTHAK